MAERQQSEENESLRSDLHDIIQEEKEGSPQVTESEWLGIMDNAYLRLQSTKTLVEEKNGKVFSRYYLQTTGAKYLVFKCSRYARNNSLKQIGHSCHARIRISADLQKYQVSKNTGENKNILYHRHTCSKDGIPQ
jgi:hypothetical protein